MNLQYDYVIVGAGLYGSIFAHEATRRGYTCLVIDKRSHIGGNCYTENMYGINVHMYGPHIFHTNIKRVWDYMCEFTEFNNFVYRPKVYGSDNKLYSFPINLMTMYQVFGTDTPSKAIERIKSEIKIDNNDNLESWIKSQVGETLSNLFIKKYTEKQWNKPIGELPSSIIKRLPIRYNFNDNYFNDAFQGIPIGGYTKIFDKLLSGSTVFLNTSYNKDVHERIARRKIIYTGPIDEYFNYSLGTLEYRSLKFDNEIHKGDYQGNAVINYANDAQFTRIIEHRHFEHTDSLHTIVTKEYPSNWNINKVPYYPIEDDKNTKLFNEYLLQNTNSKLLFRGRLGTYKYLDMSNVVQNALSDVGVEFSS